MELDTEICPQCGAKVPIYRNPAPTADIVIYRQPNEVVLIERKNPPFGFALPGGFMNVGESIEETAVREAFEETHLNVRLCGLLGVYSIPGRDPRRHTITTVFVAEAANPDDLQGSDDARAAHWTDLYNLPVLAFDHGRILHDFAEVLADRRRIADVSYPETVDVPKTAFC